MSYVLWYDVVQVFVFEFKKSLLSIEANAANVYNSLHLESYFETELRGAVLSLPAVLNT